MTIPSIFKIDGEYEESLFRIDPISVCSNLYVKDQYGDGIKEFFQKIFGTIGNIFKSPITRSILNVAKDIGDPLLDVGLQHIAKKGKKSKAFADIINIGRQAVKTASKKQRGEGLPAAQLRNLLSNRRNLQRKKTAYYKKYISKRRMLSDRRKKKGILGFAPFIARSVVPLLLKRMRGAGIRIYKPLTPSYIKFIESNIQQRLKEQKGGRTMNILSSLQKRKQKGGIAILPIIAALAPLGITLATTVLPIVIDLITKATQRKQVGSGAKKKLIKALGDDFSKALFLAASNGQSGKGILDFFKNIGTKFIGVAKKVLPFLIPIFNSLAPIAKQSVLRELRKSDKGAKLAGKIEKGLDIGKKFIDVGKTAYQKFKN